MAKVKFIKDVCIRSKWHRPGDVADIDDDVASRLLRTGGVAIVSDAAGSRSVKQVRFLRPTTVNGRWHGAGAYVDLEGRQAEALRAANVVVFPDEPGWTGQADNRPGPMRRENAALNINRG